MIATGTAPMNTYGTILPNMSSIGRTGVVMSISMLPRSRSRTIAAEVNMIMVMVRITATNPGTMCTTLRCSGLYSRVTSKVGVLRLGGLSSSSTSGMPRRPLIAEATSVSEPSTSH